MKKILVVEEMDGVRDLVSRSLSDMGFEVIVAPLSAKGVERNFKEFEEEVVCVISDGRINARIDGVDVVKIVMSISRKVPIIALTADSLIGVSMLKAGADWFLQKPFNLGEFRSIVKNLIGR